MQENTTKELKTPMTTKQKVWFGVKIALNVVFYILILLVLLFSISNIRAKNKMIKFLIFWKRLFKCTF